MEVSGSYHGNTLMLLPSEDVEASIASINYNFHEYIYSMEASMSLHIPLNICGYFHEYHKLPALLNFQLLQQDSHKGPPTSVRSAPMVASTSFHGIYFLGWKLPWKSVEVEAIPWTLVEASNEVHRSFPCRSKWKLLLLPSIAASSNIFLTSSHQLSNTQYNSVYLTRITNFQLLPQD